MQTAIWIAWRELQGRGVRLFLNIALVSMAVALCIAMELVSMARENAVAAKIDNIGPALKLIPQEVTAIDHARYRMGTRILAEKTVANLQFALSKWVRAVEGRLVFKNSLRGFSAPVIGINPEKVISPFEALKHLDHGKAAIGFELASMLHKGNNDTLELNGRLFEIFSVLPAAGDSEDTAIFISLQDAQQISGLKAAVNEIRIFPYPGSSLEDLEAFLQTKAGEINVIRTSRGEVAEQKVAGSLRRYRAVLYIVVALVVAICLMIGTYLNTKERTLEMATLFAIGSTNGTVFAALVFRSIIVGFFGALLGYTFGALFALIQDFSAAIGAVWSLNLFLTTLSATIGVIVLATLPVSFSAAFSNHVSMLQDV